MKSSNDNILHKNFGARVKQIRESKNLSREALANKSGLSFRYIANVEDGERFMKLANLHKLADGLEVPLKTLFEDFDTDTNNKLSTND